mmetsp:Transcript_12995/g.40011  ORF Transcript_12995/g.40011 Transcript_12995/m.40011 type:complete len:247 (+) Transcript_12995:547-1287(+)
MACFTASSHRLCRSVVNMFVHSRIKHMTVATTATMMKKPSMLERTLSTVSSMVAVVKTSVSVPTVLCKMVVTLLAMLSCAAPSPVTLTKAVCVPGGPSSEDLLRSAEAYTLSKFSLDIRMGEPSANNSLPLKLNPGIFESISAGCTTSRPALKVHCVSTVMPSALRIPPATATRTGVASGRSSGFSSRPDSRDTIDGSAFLYGVSPKALGTTSSLGSRNRFRSPSDWYGAAALLTVMRSGNTVLNS